MTTPEDRVVLGDDVVVVVQCDSIRLIGRLDTRRPSGPEDPQLGYPLTLHDVGAILITRGVAEGPIKGTMVQVKQLNISTLDYAEAPIQRLVVERASMSYTDVTLDEAGRKNMRIAYEEFLNRKTSTVQHARTDGVLP